MADQKITLYVVYKNKLVSKNIIQVIHTNKEDADICVENLLRNDKDGNKFGNCAITFEGESG